MRITLDIPNEHAHALLSLLANLTAKHEEPQADPAPGHPELPLTEIQVAFESTHDGGRSSRFIKDFMTPANNQLHNFCEMDATFAAIQAGKTQTVQEWCESRIAAADPFKVAMDDPVEADPEDPTRRELPWGDLPDPPPLPEGKTRWVNRGSFPLQVIDAPGRYVRWLSLDAWELATLFPENVPHIEAI